MLETNRALKEAHHTRRHGRFPRGPWGFRAPYLDAGVVRHNRAIRPVIRGRDLSSSALVSIVTTPKSQQSQSYRKVKAMQEAACINGGSSDARYRKRSLSRQRSDSFPARHHSCGEALETSVAYVVVGRNMSRIVASRCIL